MAEDRINEMRPVYANENGLYQHFDTAQKSKMLIPVVLLQVVIS